MKFDSKAYGPLVAGILALDGDGERLMPLAAGRCSSADALARIQSAAPEELFPRSSQPQAALSGLYLYFSCIDQAHEIAQSVHTAEGSYWHGIVHRQEPDPDNARYWFLRVGSHPIFADLARSAQELGLAEAGADGQWDPGRFVEMCDRARREPHHRRPCWLWKYNARNGSFSSTTAPEGRATRFEKSFDPVRRAADRRGGMVLWPQAGHPRGAVRQSGAPDTGQLAAHQR